MLALRSPSRSTAEQVVAGISGHRHERVVLRVMRNDPTLTELDLGGDVPHQTLQVVHVLGVRQEEAELFVHVLQVGLQRRALFVVEEAHCEVQLRRGGVVLLL